MSNLIQETERFSRVFDTLEEAKSYAKRLHRNELLQFAKRLMSKDKGFEKLYGYAHRFEEAGLFSETPWENPSKLQPPLVAGTLKAKGDTSLLEALSELRMLAIAKGVYRSSKITSADALHFLNEVMAQNIQLLFPEETEAARVESGQELERAHDLFEFMAKHLSVDAILHSLLNEIERLAVQRPIMVDRIKSMIKTANKTVENRLKSKDRIRLKKYYEAICGPTPLSRKAVNPGEYENLLQKTHKKELRKEAEIFADSMEATGLVSEKHAVLLRHLNRQHPDAIFAALGLNEKGKANLQENEGFVRQLIDMAIFPETCQSIFGLSRLLERGVLSFPPVVPGLRRLVDLELHPEVRENLQGEQVSPNSLLAAGTISVLGQPLGIGQGMNPTCQSARGISLWAQHAQGNLLDYISRAARDGEIEMQLEGAAVNSRMLGGGLAPALNKNLDPVSLVLVPHLDKIYDEMMKRVMFRGEDGHKWVNPAIYGRWVSSGFAAVTDAYTGAVKDYGHFVRLFYATHHPQYNDGHELIYPNPVGIFITNIHANLLGLHAISIQRIGNDPDGKLRIYFYNPNNDGGQNWGQNIHCSIYGNGELEGESSLPFEQFVSRMYAFHYNPHETGDLNKVDDRVVQEIQMLAKESWGKNYTWF